MTTNWQDTAKQVFDLVKPMVPVVEGLINVAAPGAAQALSIAEKLIQALFDGEPTAEALFNQIKNGIVPGAAQLQAWSDDYESAYQKLKADLAAG